MEQEQAQLITTVSLVRLFILSDKDWVRTYPWAALNFDHRKACVRSQLRRERKAANDALDFVNGHISWCPKENVEFVRRGIESSPTHEARIWGIKPPRREMVAVRN